MDRYWLCRGLLQIKVNNVNVMLLWKQQHTMLGYEIANSVTHEVMIPLYRAMGRSQCLALSFFLDIIFQDVEWKWSEMRDFSFEKSLIRAKSLRIKIKRKKESNLYFLAVMDKLRSEGMSKGGIYIAHQKGRWLRVITWCHTKSPFSPEYWSSRPSLILEWPKSSDLSSS